LTCTAGPRRGSGVLLKSRGDLLKDPGVFSYRRDPKDGVATKPEAKTEEAEVKNEKAEVKNQEVLLL